jgi:hypothetical protein
MRWWACLLILSAVARAWAKRSRADPGYQPVGRGDAAHLAELRAAFLSADADADAHLSPVELNAWLAARPARVAAKRRADVEERWEQAVREVSLREGAGAALLVGCARGIAVPFVVVWLPC